MGVEINASPARKPASMLKTIALALAAAASLAGANAPAHADAADDLLDKLHAKGILSDDEYRQLRDARSAEAARPVQPASAAPVLSASGADGESTTVGGVAFIDLTHIDQTNNGTKAATSGDGLDVKRGYLVIDHRFDKTWSADLTTDFNFIAADSETQLFVKKAYVQANVSDALAIRAGSADMPWIPFAEVLYGYRYVENVLIDRLKLGNSADWGIHTFGKLGPDGNMNYAVSGVNGNGYKNPTRSHHIDLEGRLAFTPIGGLTLAGGFYSGDLGKDVVGSATPVQHTAERWDALAAYVSPLFRLGGEYVSAKNWNQVTAVPEDKSDGYSLWGSYSLNPQLALFTRFDSAKPKKDLAPSFEDQYYNLGLSYAVRRNIDLALAYKHENVKNGLLASSNGTLTGGTTADGKYEEVGLWAQVKF